MRMIRKDRRLARRRETAEDKQKSLRAFAHASGREAFQALRSGALPVAPGARNSIGLRQRAQSGQTRQMPRLCRCQWRAFRRHLPRAQTSLAWRFSPEQRSCHAQQADRVQRAIARSHRALAGRQPHLPMPYRLWATRERSSRGGLPSRQVLQGNDLVSRPGKRRARHQGTRTRGAAGRTALSGSGRSSVRWGRVRHHPHIQVLKIRSFPCCSDRAAPLPNALLRAIPDKQLLERRRPGLDDEIPEHSLRLLRRRSAIDQLQRLSDRFLLFQLTHSSLLVSIPYKPRRHMKWRRGACEARWPRCV